MNNTKQSSTIRYKILDLGDEGMPVPKRPVKKTKKKEPLKNVVIHGDSLEVLKTMPDNSVDSFVTDPPYGLSSKEPDIEALLLSWIYGVTYAPLTKGGFMGKEWDAIVPSPAVWKECFRVLKPGGFLPSFAGTRTYDLMGISIRLAGFEVRDMIEWLYLSGFPKSMDVGKQFDKSNGSKAQFVEESTRFGVYLKECRTAKGLSMRAIDDALGLNTSCSWWEGRKRGVQPPSKANYLRLKPILDLDNRFDEFIDRVEAEREKVGERTGAQAESTGRYGAWGNDDGTGRSKFDITAPATDLAKQWDGWGTALKPAHEPIVMARKPIEKTVAYNVEKYGTGAVNIDATRIAYKDEADIETVRAKCNFTEASKSIGFGTKESLYGTGSTPLQQARDCVREEGRFPANCITLDTDEWYSKYFNVSPQEVSKKASKKDRNSTWDGRQIDTPSGHPTVKPTDLMAWLVRLVTPPGGVVLDPFAGSGSTLVAAKREGFNFIGIEMDEQYVEIARKRVREEDGDE